MILAYIVILGLIFGSFLNVCIYRIPEEQSLSFPPSHCMRCGSRIKPYDLIPVLSYILLKGKCRNCGDKISLRYPAIELITGVLFGALYIEYGLSFLLVKYAVLICFLIVIGMIDFDTTDVYFKTTISGILAGVGFLIYGYFLNINVTTFIFGAVLGGGVIALIILLTHGMGWGDAEICLLVGLFLGFKLTVLMLFLSFVIGGITGITLILTKLKSRKDYIPFGPFIAISAIICAIFGEKIIMLYLNIFLS